MENVHVTENPQDESEIFAYALTDAKAFSVLERACLHGDIRVQQIWRGTDATDAIHGKKWRNDNTDWSNHFEAFTEGDPEYNHTAIVVNEIPTVFGKWKETDLQAVIELKCDPSHSTDKYEFLDHFEDSF